MPSLLCSAVSLFHVVCEVDFGGAERMGSDRATRICDYYCVVFIELLSAIRHFWKVFFYARHTLPYLENMESKSA